MRHIICTQILRLFNGFSLLNVFKPPDAIWRRYIWLLC